MMNKRFLQPIIIIFLMGFATEALGCSICVTATADAFLPPIRLWVLLSITWFVSSGIIGTITGIRLPWQPAFLGSFLIAASLLIAGGALLGLAVVLVLFIPPVMGFTESVIRGFPEAPEPGVRATKILGWVHVFGLVCAGVLLVQIHLTRTPEEYIAKWGFHGLGRSRFQELLSREPQSLNAYRHLVQHAADVVANAAAERIGEIGEPQHDIPILQEALDRLGGPGPLTSGIETSLERLESRRNSPRTGD
jgi:hypothetical protein